MIELHERLSEFSYGYGITREIEQLLSGVGIKTAPFLPSLVQEADLGFDVGFKKPGAAILVQFKLGQSVRRFVRPKLMKIAPSVGRPFWRFNVNTAEPEGQYETLLKAEEDGAEAYYAAPRFVDWHDYLTFYEADNVLENSLLIRPTEIRDKLTSQNLPDGLHKVVYDDAQVFVCSEPVQVSETRPEQFAIRIQEKLHQPQPLLEDSIRKIFDGLQHRHQIRRDQPRDAPDEESVDSRFEIDSKAIAIRAAARERRLNDLKARARSEADAIGAAVGIEMWSLGIQLIFAYANQE